MTGRAARAISSRAGEPLAVAFHVSSGLAIGDGPNDCELLAAAAVTVVPSDACARALDRADHVVASPRDGGWAQILDLV